MKLTKLLFGFCFLMMSFGLHGQEVADSNESARHFVQGFYDWYVPLALKAKDDPAWAIVVKEKPSYLDEGLVRSLKKNLEEQEKDEGEIVGIDFDPFLNSQDPAVSYVVGDVVSKGNVYRVDVWAGHLGKKGKKANVIAEVSRKNGAWKFSNFYYGKSRNLISVLGAQKY